MKHRVAFLGLTLGLTLVACGQNSTGQRGDARLGKAALGSCAPVSLDQTAYYRITARHSGKVMDVSGAGTVNGTNVIQQTFSGATNQQWQLSAVDGGFYKITARHSGKVLDVSDVSLNNGAWLHQWDYVGGDNQKWCLQPTDSGYYKILAKHSGKAADVDGISTADGAHIHQWDYVGGANQQWRLDVVASGSTGGGSTGGGSTGGTLPSPVRVSKTRTNKVFVHVMPWFESKDFSGYWGQHWTMANQNPDVVDSTGRRQIASHYYPLTGPYASADPDIIEYQLLLMKLSGIDGVLIDWPGTTNLYDYPRNKANSEAIIGRLGKVGLGFGIIYEDQNINIAYGKGVVTDKIGQAKNDMTYLKNNYFPQSSYINVNGRPLLGVFGPQTFQSPSDWQQIFSVFTNKPCFLSLWYEYSEVSGSSECTGEYSWVYQDGTPHLSHLSNFYQNRPNYGVKMGSAYPGFRDFYAQGGWGSNNFYIASNGTGTFNDTLNLSLNANIPYLQLVTWNDYGEGTMIEPTREFGYSLLTLLQQKLGVPYTQSELELVMKLFTQRRQYKGNAQQQTRLDRASAYLAALQIDQARNTLSATP